MHQHHSVQYRFGRGHELAAAPLPERLLAHGGNTINYNLYTAGDYATIWGNTVNTDTLAFTGNGAEQTYTIYGRVPPQTTPAPATYTDLITVTITY